MHQPVPAQVSLNASVDLCAIAIGLNRRERRESLPSRLRGSGHNPVIDLTKEILAGQTSPSSSTGRQSQNCASAIIAGSHRDATSTLAEGVDGEVLARTAARTSRPIAAQSRMKISSPRSASRSSTSAIAEREADIEPNGVPDDLGRELAAGERDGHAPSYPQNGDALPLPCQSRRGDHEVLARLGDASDQEPRGKPNRLVYDLGREPISGVADFPSCFVAIPHSKHQQAVRAVTTPIDLLRRRSSAP